MIKRYSLVALFALAAGTSAMAADDLASMFKEGNLDGRLRAQYFYTNWNDNTSTTGKGSSDAKGLGVGGSLIYKTAKLNGFSVGMGLYTAQNPGSYTQTSWGAGATTSSDLYSRDLNKASYGDGYSVLGQLYMQYNISKTEAKAGRFLMTNPFINPNDTKMIPLAIEGASVTSNEFANTKIVFDIASKVKQRGMDYFGNMADTLDTPEKIAAKYATHYTTSGQTSNGAYNSGYGDPSEVKIVGIQNKSIDGLELQGWYMNWANLVDQAMLEANYAFGVGDAIVSFGGRYMNQFDRGAGVIIAPSGASANGDNNNKVDTHMTALRMVTNYHAAKLLFAYSITDKGGDLIAPWRGFPTEGYTRSMTQTDWNANTKAYKVGMDYDLNQMINGLSTAVSYSYYDRDPSKKPYQSMTNRGYGNDDTYQWNMDIVYKMAGNYKGTELKARFMDQRNDNDTVSPSTTKNLSNREMRLEANYRF